MTGLLELAERCEQAAGPDREMDTAIFTAINPHLFAHKTKPHFFVDNEKLRDTEYQSRNTFVVPRYTASLDAAMTLVPEGCSATVWTAGPRGFTNGPAARIFTFTADDEAVGGYSIGSASAHEITAVTPALAICAAALRARHTLAA